MRDKTLPIKTGKKERYLNALMVLHDIKQAELVNKLGVSASLVSRVINGKRRGIKRTGRLVRQAIADALGMKVEELWPDNKAA